MEIELVASETALPLPSQASFTAWKLQIKLTLNALASIKVQP
jgi:hypothetical protein